MVLYHHPLTPRLFLVLRPLSSRDKFRLTGYNKNNLLYLTRGPIGPLSPFTARAPPPPGWRNIELLLRLQPVQPVTYRQHIVAVHQTDHLRLVQVLLVPDGGLLLAVPGRLVGILGYLQLLQVMSSWSVIRLDLDLDTTVFPSLLMK